MPFGKASVVRDGATSWCSPGARWCSGRSWRRSRPERDGVSVAVVDLRTIVPYDWDTIAAYTQRTSRVVVAHEDQLTCGFGAEIAARIADELFDYLDAPVKRVAALDTPVAYSPVLEEAILPGSADVLAAIRTVAEVLASVQSPVGRARAWASPFSLAGGHRGRGGAAGGGRCHLPARPSTSHTTLSTLDLDVAATHHRRARNASS